MFIGHLTNKRFATLLPAFSWNPVSDLGVIGVEARSDIMKRHHEQYPAAKGGALLSSDGKRNRNIPKSTCGKSGQEPEKAACKSDGDLSHQHQKGNAEGMDRGKQGNSSTARVGSGTATGGTNSRAASVGSVGIVPSTAPVTGNFHEQRREVGDGSPEVGSSERHPGSGDGPSRVEKRNKCVRVPPSPPRPHSSPAALTSCPFTLPGQNLGPGYELRHRVPGPAFNPAIPDRCSSASSSPSSSSSSRVVSPVLSSSGSSSSSSTLSDTTPPGQQPVSLLPSCVAKVTSPSAPSGPLLSRGQLEATVGSIGCSFSANNSASTNLSSAASSSGCSSAASSPSPPFTVGDRYADVTRSMVKFYDDNVQTNDIFTKKMQLRQAIYAIVKDTFPYCGLYVVGSSMNGFGSITSDMDMCLMICQQEIDQHREAQQILGVVNRGLRKCAYIIDLDLIRAKVPIIKFRDKISGVECDLNVNNSVGIRNTHLLSFYSKADWRVRPLVMTVKHWAKCQQIGDASRRTISSYSLELMTIHFLQVGCSPPVLPCLQKEFPEMFDPGCDIRSLSLNEELPAPFSSKNSQTLGELFINFLEYYSETFNFDRDAISVRLGRAVQREVVQYYSSPKNSPHLWKSLCIEEPFDHTNTARSVWDPTVFNQIKFVIEKSRDQLIKTGDIETILQSPYVPFDEQLLAPY